LRQLFYCITFSCSCQVFFRIFFKILFSDFSKPSLRQLFYYITFSYSCQVLFSTFFFKKSFVISFPVARYSLHPPVLPQQTYRSCVLFLATFIFYHTLYLLSTPFRHNLIPCFSVILCAFCYSSFCIGFYRQFFTLFFLFSIENYFIL